jgi:hypothetical protein
MACHSLPHSRLPLSAHAMQPSPPFATRPGHGTQQAELVRSSHDGAPAQAGWQQQQQQQQSQHCCVVGVWGCWDAVGGPQWPPAGPRSRPQPHSTGACTAVVLFDELGVLTRVASAGPFLPARTHVLAGPPTTTTAASTSYYQPGFLPSSSTGPAPDPIVGSASTLAPVLYHACTCGSAPSRTLLPAVNGMPAACVQGPTTPPPPSEVCEAACDAATAAARARRERSERPWADAL